MGYRTVAAPGAAAAALLLFPAVSCLAGEAAAPARPAAPAYSVVRFDENYRYLADHPDEDFFDPIKYIGLGDDPDWYLSFGGQARYRYEDYDNLNFGAGPQDDDGYHLLRLLGHVDAHFGENVRAFVTLKSAWVTDRDPGERQVDEDDFDVDQAFADLRLPMGDDLSVTVRGGRQYLAYGAQRLISPLDWVNSRRTFDGGKVMFGFGERRQHLFDAFYVHPVIVDEGPINSYDDDDNFYGGYYTWMIQPQQRLEVYGLLLDRSDGSFAQGAGEEDRYSIGTRYAATEGAWSYDFEGTYQFGEFDDGDISAWSVAGQLSYQFDDLALRPKPFIGFDVASGDDDLDDEDLGTFNQLFPLGHPYFGFIDAIGRQNIMDVHTGVVLNFTPTVSLHTEYYWFWRQDEADAVYNAGGGILRNPMGSDERYVGSELDLLLNWQVDRHLNLMAGYSHFWAGDFIEDTGPDDDIDFFYAGATYTF